MEKTMYFVFRSVNQLARVVTDKTGAKRYEAYYPKNGVFGWHEDEAAEAAVRWDEWDWHSVSEDEVPELMKHEKEVRGMA